MEGRGKRQMEEKGIKKGQRKHKIKERKNNEMWKETEGKNGRIKVRKR